VHGLDGHADACEDGGDVAGAQQLREIAAEIRAPLPGSADPGAVVFEWGLRFTAASGRQFEYEWPDEGTARDALDETARRPESAQHWALIRRVRGPWVEVPVDAEAGDG
jgi:hypothetical protein